MVYATTVRQWDCNDIVYNGLLISLSPDLLSPADILQLLKTWTIDVHATIEIEILTGWWSREPGPLIFGTTMCMRTIGPKIILLEFVVNKGGGYLQAKVLVCVEIEKFPRYSWIETKESFGSVQAESCLCGLQRVVRMLHYGRQRQPFNSKCWKGGWNFIPVKLQPRKMHKIDMKAYNIL